MTRAGLDAKTAVNRAGARESEDGRAGREAITG